jgi:hypothetical protein
MRILQMRVLNETALLVEHGRQFIEAEEACLGYFRAAHEAVADDAAAVRDADQATSRVVVHAPDPIERDLHARFLLDLPSKSSFRLLGVLHEARWQPPGIFGSIRVAKEQVLAEVILNDAHNAYLEMRHEATLQSVAGCQVFKDSPNGTGPGKGPRSEDKRPYQPAATAAGVTVSVTPSRTTI